MNQLDKIDFTLYLRKGQKYKFLKYINDYSDEKDLFIFYKDKEDIICDEKNKIKERVDRWINEKSDIVPDKESWEIWRWVKIYEECKYDYSQLSSKNFCEFLNNSINKRVNQNPFDDINSDKLINSDKI
jgi:hypothetical protein